MLLRLFMPGGSDGGLGNWWFTPHELTREPMLCYYGEGDVATTANHADTINPLQMRNADGTSGAARQIYLPSPTDCPKAFALMRADGMGTDASLCLVVGPINWTKLPFEQDQPRLRLAALSGNSSSNRR